MGFIKDLFRVDNFVSGLKSAVINFVLFLVSYFISWYSGWYGLSENTFNMVLLVWVVVSLFLWGYLARTFWGWK